MLLIKYLKVVKKWYERIHVLNADIRKYKRAYAGMEYGRGEVSTAARNIMVYSHVVEKGLSHKIIKPLFGYKKVGIIADSLKTYLQNNGNDQYIIDLAVSTLRTYNRINKEMGIASDKLFVIPEEVISNGCIDVGTTECYAEQLFNIEPGAASCLIKKRHSIRLYDYKSLPISLSEIKECIETAQSSPSACNRQAVRVKIIMNDGDIKKVSSIQGGSDGFGANAGAILVITSDLSLYEPAERRIPMFDCGLFTMNLVYALLEKKIGSCILNGSFTLEREKEIRKIIPISNHEMYACLIALSRISLDQKVKITKSHKKSVDEIISIV